MSERIGFNFSPGKALRVVRDVKGRLYLFRLRHDFASLGRAREYGLLGDSLAWHLASHSIGLRSSFDQRKPIRPLIWSHTLNIN